MPVGDFLKLEKKNISTFRRYIIELENEYISKYGTY